MLAHWPTHYKKEIRQSLSLTCHSNTQIVTWYSLIPVPRAKCQCGCSRCGDLAGWVWGTNDLWRRKPEGKENRSQLLGNTYHWNGRWTGSRWPGSKSRPWKQLFGKQRQEVSTVSAANPEAIGPAMEAEGMVVSQAGSKLHSSNFHLKKHTDKSLLNTPFIPSINSH